MSGRLAFTDRRQNLLLELTYCQPKFAAAIVFPDLISKLSNESLRRDRQVQRSDLHCLWNCLSRNPQIPVEPPFSDFHQVLESADHRPSVPSQLCPANAMLKAEAMCDL
jgi:hypothetical protein